MTTVNSTTAARIGRNVGPTNMPNGDTTIQDEDGNTLSDGLQGAAVCNAAYVSACRWADQLGEPVFATDGASTVEVKPAGLDNGTYHWVESHDAINRQEEIYGPDRHIVHTSRHAAEQAAAAATEALAAADVDGRYAGTDFHAESGPLPDWARHITNGTTRIELNRNRRAPAPPA